MIDSANQTEMEIMGQFLRCLTESDDGLSELVDGLFLAVNPVDDTTISHCSCLSPSLIFPFLILLIFSVDYFPLVAVANLLI